MWQRQAHRRASEMTNTPGDTTNTHGDEQLPHLTKGGGGRSEMKAFAVGMATSGWTTCAARRRGGEERSRVEGGVDV